jgi:hypothetical protein
LGHNKAIWAIAHRLCRLTWKILHQGVRYVEFGNRPNPRAVRKRASRLLRGTPQPRIPATSPSATSYGPIMTRRPRNGVFGRAFFGQVQARYSPDKNADQEVRPTSCTTL